MIKLGSHVSFAAPDYYAGSIQEALSYKANALMLYTGPPQNNKRVPMEKCKVEEGLNLLKENHIHEEDVIIHAPYLINLANTLKEDVFTFSKELLKSELLRSEILKAKYMVLHPGSHLKEGVEKGIASVISGLNEVLKEDPTDVTICLETMAGKGSELGVSFEELREMIFGCAYPERLAVCFDTCHTNDAGYDLQDFDKVLEEFDKVIGLDRLKVVHLNDSKNPVGAHKDRHANLGYGTIGFETLCSIAYHPALQEVCKILETPYVNAHAPYGLEIESIRRKEFNSQLMELGK